MIRKLERKILLLSFSFSRAIIMGILTTVVMIIIKIENILSDQDDVRT